MTTLFKTPWLTLAAAALLAGCQHSSQPVKLHGENFQPDEEAHATQNICAAQAATGARRDATLYPCHFGEHGLNALGRQKLDLMLEDDEPATPLVVYLDPSLDYSLAKAHQSVTDYLKGKGLPESQLRLQDGPNPQTRHPAAEALTQLQNLQSQGQQGQQQQQQQYQQGQQPPAGPGLPGLTGNAPGDSTANH